MGSYKEGNTRARLKELQEGKKEKINSQFQTAKTPKCTWGAFGLRSVVEEWIGAGISIVMFPGTSCSRLLMIEIGI